MSDKTFYINLKVETSSNGNYKVSVSQIDFLRRTSLTKNELNAINDGCEAMAQKLSDIYDQEIAELSAVGFGL